MREFSYNSAKNVPILHRKEAFLPPNHPKSSLFLALTKEEEAEGLYDNVSTIGFKNNWQELLHRKGLSYDGHKLIKVIREAERKQSEDCVVHRHKTAISRNRMSRPFRCMIEYGLLAKDDTFFDYGCGLGDDLRALGELGYTGSGWDPVYQPDNPVISADVVNLGFVLNVIEEPSERVEVLQKAFALTKKVMCVATMTEAMAATGNWAPYKDGVLTQKGTFQKYFKQDELRQFLEDVLHVTAVPVELGVFLVFKSEQVHQTFVSERTKRNIDWETLSYRLYPRKERKAKVQIYESNKSIFDDFWSKMIS